MNEQGNPLALYELSQDYIQALDVFTDPENDIPIEAVNDTLEGIEGQLQDKAINIAKFMRNLETTAKAIKEAEQQMAKRRKALENRSQWLKDYLKNNMEKSGITKIESPWLRLAIQNNPESVDLVDEQAIPHKFREEVVTVKINKNAIKKVLQDGVDVPGAALKQTTRLAIR